jgi:hypothetical protein
VRVPRRRRDVDCPRRCPPCRGDDGRGDVDDDFVDAAGDLVDAAEDVEAEATEDVAPQVGRGRGSVRTATWRRGRVPYLLNDVIAARAEVERAERVLAKRVKSARAHGATWEDLGLALSMSRQGVAKRYGG